MPIDSFHVREAVELAGRIRGGRAGEVRQQTAALLEALELGEWQGALGQTLSGGVKRLVGFCMATVRPGRLVILDEPTNDVDPRRRRLMWEQIRALGARGCSVLLVTHNVLEAEKSVDRLAVIHKGCLVAEGTPSSLKAADRSHLRLQLMLAPGAETPPSRRGPVRPYACRAQPGDDDRRDGRLGGDRLGRSVDRRRRSRGVRPGSDNPGGRLHPPDVPHVERWRRRARLGR